MNALRRWFQTDDRSSSQVREDVREELRLHRDLLEADLIAQGLSESAARAQALARFGDPAAWEAQSCKVILEDRIMLQRITLGLVLILVAALGWNAWEARAARREMQGEMAKLREDLTALMTPGRTRENPIREEQPGFVYMSSEFKRPGPYQFTKGLTLARIITSAGGAPAGHTKVTISRNQFGRVTSATFDLDKVGVPGGEDPEIQPNDIIALAR
jgi:hypothetical protein